MRQKILSGMTTNSRGRLSREFSRGRIMKSNLKNPSEGSSQGNRLGVLAAQGAEAIIVKEGNFIIKNRIPKSYRIKELDEKIRKQRTKAETKLLEKASAIINSPKPIETKETYQIKMPFVEGKKLSESLDSFPLKKQKEICKTIGKEIAKLHEANIIHGDLTTSNMLLVDKKGYPENFKRLLVKLKELNLPKGEFGVFGSGALAVRGIRDSRDLDIIAKRFLWNKLIKKFPVKKYFSKEYIDMGEIEIWKDWMPLTDNVDALIDDADIIEGIRFVKLKDIINLKKIQNREKDIKDIQLIEQYQKRGDNNFQIFLIDFGLGYISDKIEDKAVDLHLLKQALEARHFKNWKILFEEVEKGYKNYNESKKVLERLKAVEKRGRYK